MELLSQTVINGLSLGASYAVVAVGLTLIFGILGLANFAHGAFYALGGYAIVAATAFGVPYLAALPLAAVAVALLAYPVELLIVRRNLYGDMGHRGIIVFFALGQAIVALLVLLGGGDPLPVRSPFDLSALRLGSLTIGGQRAFVLAASCAVLAAFGMWLRHSVGGAQLRAIADNPRGALYSGIDVPRMRSLAFVVGAGAAGLAGGLIAPMTTVFPTVGDTPMVFAFTVVILGGLGSIAGALIASLLVGLGSSLFETYVSVSMTSALGWVLVIGMLLLRPQGLLGRTLPDRH